MKHVVPSVVLALFCCSFYCSAGENPASGNKMHEPELAQQLSLARELPKQDSTQADTAKADESAFPLTFGFDMVSRYVWRGVDYGSTPAFQPGLKYHIGKKKVTFDLGAWASYSITGNYAEMDLYATLNLPFVWVGVTDYFFPNESVGDDQYFHYGENTAHVFEGAAGFALPAKFPLTGFVAYDFHSPVTDPDNSIYFELGYPFTLKKEVTLNVFAGAAQGDYYTQSGDFNVVNVGLKVAKNFDIKGKVKFPLSVSLITNPDAQKLYLVAAIGLWNQ